MAPDVFNLQKPSIKIKVYEIGLVDEVEGATGRNFKLLRRKSTVSSEAVAQTFRLVLSVTLETVW